MLKELLKDIHNQLENGAHSEYWARREAQENAIKKFFPEAEDGDLFEISPKNLLLLIKDYNSEEKPSLEATKFITDIKFGDYDSGRVLSQEEAKEVIKAYQKCAKILAEEKDVDDEKRTLCHNIEMLVRNHVETSNDALDIYDGYLFDVREAINGIRLCMSKFPKLLGKGFKAMHKTVVAVCKKEEIKQKSSKPDKWRVEPKYAASDDLRQAFGVLCQYYAKPRLEAHLDTVIENFLAFDEYMKTFQIANIVMHNRDDASYLTKTKMHILFLSLQEAEKGECLFGEIYRKKRAEAEENGELMQAQKIDRTIQEDIERMKARHVNKKLIDLSEIEFVYVGEERPTLQKFKFVLNYSPYSSNNHTPSKPKGGLWASPVQSNGRTDWENWLDEMDLYTNKTNRESYYLQDKGNNRYYLVPKEGCRILYADHVSKFAQYFERTASGRIVEYADIPQIDYGRLFRDYDAIYVPERWGDIDCVFRSWSVETLLIGRLNKFEVMDEQEYEQYRAQQFEKVAEQASEGDKLVFKKAGKTAFNKRLMLTLRDKKQKQ